jgi:hypothetical protein
MTEGKQIMNIRVKEPLGIQNIAVGRAENILQCTQTKLNVAWKQRRYML